MFQIVRRCLNFIEGLEDFSLLRGGAKKVWLKATYGGKGPHGLASRGRATMRPTNKVDIWVIFWSTL